MAQFIEKQRNSGLREDDFRHQASSVSGKRNQLTPLPFDENNSPKGKFGEEGHHLAQLQTLKYWFVLLGGFGRLRHRYTGKHSEGNRFIRNHEL